MSSNPLLYAMFFHVCWVFFLYVLLTAVRAPAIWALDTKSGTLRKRASLEPRISANLSNQFEWPLLFYVCCILLIVSSEPIGSVQIVLAWIFVIGRVAHSLVQILTTNIRLRGTVFSLNFVAVLLMWIQLIRASI